MFKSDNNKGIAFILVLIIMTVSAIVIAIILSINTADAKEASNQEQRMQARYIARAGADAAAKYVQDHTSEFNPLTFTSKSIPTTAIGEGSFSAEITKPYNGSIIVQSIGVVAGLTEQVSITLSKGSYNGLFTGIRQTENQPMDLSGLAITYETGATPDVEGNVESTNETEINLSDNNPNNEADPNITKKVNNDSAGQVILPPDYLTYTDTAQKVAQTTTLTGNYYLSSLSKGNNETIIFNTQGGNQNIVVDNISFGGSQGTVEIVGGGVVHLYILNSGSIDNPVNVNQGTPAQLFIYVDQGAVLALQANCNLYGYIYAPEATVELQSDQTQISGAIIGNILRKNSTQGPHGQFHYVPLPDDTDYSGLLVYVRNYFSN